jgi:putative RNA 2'-phosphotransferase
MSDHSAGSRTEEDRNLGRLSKFLALVLRHRASQFELEVDDEAFVGLQDLLDLIHDQDGMEWVTAEDIDELGGTHVRRRFEIRDGRVRATYGHSFTRPIRFPAIDPPEKLYAGLAKGQAGAARATGLKPSGRQFVHLTDNLKEAEEIGLRAAPDYEIVTVLAKKAKDAGIQFHKPAEGIFLCLSIPVDHLDMPVAYGRRTRRGPRR